MAVKVNNEYVNNLIRWRESPEYSAAFVKKTRSRIIKRNHFKRFNIESTWSTKTLKQRKKE